MKNKSFTIIVDSDWENTIGDQLGNLEKVIDDLDLETYTENDGIGAYEFWGFRGYDSGTDYLAINACEDLELTVIFKTFIDESIESFIKNEIFESLQFNRDIAKVINRNEDTINASFKLVPTNTIVANIISTQQITHIATLTLEWSDEQ